MSAERHPIPDSPNMPLEDRVRHLEVYLGQLWDQVWWMNLPAAKREEYKAQGFSDPIERFYEPK